MVEPMSNVALTGTCVAPCCACVAVSATGCPEVVVSDTEVAVSNTEVAVSDTEVAVSDSDAAIGPDVTFVGSPVAGGDSGVVTSERGAGVGSALGSSAGRVNVARTTSGSGSGGGKNTPRSSPPTIMATNSTMTKPIIIGLDMASCAVGVTGCDAEGAGACELGVEVTGRVGVTGVARVVAPDGVTKRSVIGGSVGGGLPPAFSSVLTKWLAL